MHIMQLTGEERLRTLEDLAKAARNLKFIKQRDGIYVDASTLGPFLALLAVLDGVIERPAS